MSKDKGERESLFFYHVGLMDYLAFWLDSKTFYLLKHLTGFRNTFF